jgi:hypothetical protein
LLAVSALKREPGFRETVEVRALDVVGSVGPEFGPEIIDRNKENVGPGRRGIGSTGEAHRGKAKHQTEERFHIN